MIVVNGLQLIRSEAESHFDPMMELDVRQCEENDHGRCSHSYDEHLPNLAQQLDHSDFDSKILLIHLGSRKRFQSALKFQHIPLLERGGSCS